MCNIPKRGMELILNRACPMQIGSVLGRFRGDLWMNTGFMGAISRSLPCEQRRASWLARSHQGDFSHRSSALIGSTIQKRQLNAVGNTSDAGHCIPAEQSQRFLMTSSRNRYGREQHYIFTARRACSSYSNYREIRSYTSGNNKTLLQSSEAQNVARKLGVTNQDEFHTRIHLWMKGYVKGTDGSILPYTKDRLVEGNLLGSAFRDVALVLGGNNTGKTTSYLLALCDIVTSDKQQGTSEREERDEYRNKMILNRNLRSSRKPPCSDLPKVLGLPKFDWNSLLVPLAIILVPSREIGMEMFQSCSKFQLRARLLAGGKGYKKQSSFPGVASMAGNQKSSDNVDIVAATPEMLLRVMHGGFEDARIDIRYLQYLILEECDLLCEGFYLEQLSEILNMIHHEHLRILYVTSTNTDSVMKHIQQVHFDGKSEELSRVTIAHPESHTIKNDIQQVFTAISRSDPLESLLETLEELNIRGFGPDKKTLIFCNTVKCCKFLEYALKDRGYKITTLHGEMGYEQRTQSIKAFSGPVNVMVATNLASRGALNQEVDNVISFDFPFKVSEYLHRGSSVSPQGTIHTFFSKKHLPVLKNIQRLNTVDHRIEYRNVNARVARVLRLQLEWDSRIALRNRKHKKGGRKALSLPPRRNILSPANKRAMKRFYLREKAIKQVQFLRKRGILKKGYGLPKMPDKAMEESDSQEFVRMQRSSDGFLQAIPKRRSRIRSSMKEEGYDKESHFIENAPTYEDQMSAKPPKHHRKPHF